MAHLIGTIATDRFTILDPEGDLVLGEGFTADQTIGPAAEPIDWAVSELGLGMYEVTWPIQISGAYYLRLVGDSSGQVFEFTLLTDEYEVGDTITHYFTIRDDDGAYVLGSTITLDAALDPGGVSFAPIIEEMGLGLYRITWAAESTGVYTARLTATSTPGDEDQVFEFEDRVLEGEAAAISPFLTPVGPTLEDLIRGVAMACKDYMTLRASANANDGTTFPAQRHLAAKPAKTFKGADLFIKSAAIPDNVGWQAGVLDSVGGALSVTPDFPAAIRRGDQAYLVNLESSGNAREAYIEEINSRILSIFPDALRPATWTFPDAFMGEIGYVVPPPEFTHINSVSFPYDGWSPVNTFIPYAQYNDGDGWFWDQSAGRLLINAPYRAAADSYALTINGFGRWPELVEPGDTTGVDYEWLVHMAAGMLILSTRDARRQAEAAMHFNRADALRIKVWSAKPPNMIRIR